MKETLVAVAAFAAAYVIHKSAVPEEPQPAIVLWRGALTGALAPVACAMVFILADVAQGTAAWLLFFAAFALCPFAVGIGTQLGASDPQRASLRYAVLTPIVSCAMTVGFVSLLGWSGAVAICLAFPVLVLVAVPSSLAARWWLTRKQEAS